MLIPRIIIEQFFLFSDVLASYWLWLSMDSFFISRGVDCCKNSRVNGCHLHLTLTISICMLLPLFQRWFPLQQKWWNRLCDRLSSTSTQNQPVTLNCLLWLFILSLVFSCFSLSLNSILNPHLPFSTNHVLVKEMRFVWETSLREVWIVSSAGTHITVGVFGLL